MFALLAVVLMSVAALGTDIGNQVSRHTDTQRQADFGAFAAAQQMTTTAAVGTPVSPAVLDAVAASMNANQVEDDSASKAACSQTNSCVSAAQLNDGDLANGEVRYTSEGLQVIAPDHYVGFGMARIMGFDGADVGASATVNIFSPGRRVLPMFAVVGCDYGLQTLADPANGHDTPAVPTLAFNGETNDTQIQGPLILTDSSGTQVNSLALNSTGNTLTVTAQKWSNSYYVGFFRGDDTTPSLVQTVKLTAPTAAPYTKSSATAVTVNIPDAVTQSETAWYVRIYDDSGADAGSKPTSTPHTGSWSQASQALGIRVGSAVLQCSQGSSDGNFGTLRLPRTDTTPSSWLPVNVAQGLQSPLSLTKHQQWQTDSPAGKCLDGVNGAVTSPGSQGTLAPYTNCVSTDTGLPANDATQGLITGAVGSPGLLTTKNTPSGCDPNGGSSDRSVTVNGPGGGTFNIDNSVLTCYFTDTTTSIADIATASYNKGPVLDKSIVDDPRFVWVPVVAVKPDCGACANYSIIDVRPAFITDQQPFSGATKGSNPAQNGVTSDNGVTISNNGITSLKVVFFNSDALPRDVDGTVIDYLGVGPKITRLVD
ncbi:MAG: Tad domain-containing protein [Nocardioides sp.]|nr:Tad domain-containing protein [Nocardioides sp.]